MAKPLPVLFEPWKAARMTVGECSENSEILIWGHRMHEPSVNTSLLGVLSHNDGAGILMAVRPVRTDLDGAANHSQIADRLVMCVNALAGVSDPEKFMADVRAILADAPKDDVRVVRCLCRLVEPKRILDNDE